MSVLATDEMPDLLPHAPFLLAGLLVVFWVYMKVRMLRERLALRGPDDVPPKAPGWLLRLARAQHTNLVLAALAAGLIVALAWFGVLADG